MRSPERSTILRVLLLTVSGWACADPSDPGEPDLPGEDAPVPSVAGLLVSESIAIPGLRSSDATVDVTYISMRPGTLPLAQSVEIRNRSSEGSATVSYPVVDGGFDPVAVPALAKDTLELTIRYAGNATQVLFAIVPTRRPPSIVRTSPPKGRTDVALDIRPSVIFTEPIDPASVTGGSVRLLHDGALVGGASGLVSGSPWAVEFAPASPLEPLTTYEVVVTGEIRDMEGLSLGEPASFTFTTQAAAWGSGTASRIAAGWQHTCALDRTGAAWCWGGNRMGQLGTGMRADSRIPVSVAGGFRFASIASGGQHNCGLTLSGAALCWGDDTDGQLGDGAMLNPYGYEEFSSIPVGVLGGYRFTRITAGGMHTCGLTAEGSAYCWGSKSRGQVGDGSPAEWTGLERGAPVPKAVRGDLRFIDIAAGSWHTCGVTDSGAAWCWGDNERGQLGSAGVQYSATPVPVAGGLLFRAIAAGELRSCGITISGETWCWGVSSSVPTRVGGPSFEVIAAGLNHTCGITAEGGPHCWGLNAEGQLGNGTVVNSAVPVAVAGLARVSAIATGGNHTCAISESGDVYCWGNSSEGQLGDGDGPTWSADAVLGISQVTVLEAGGAHTCALTADGAAYCWGDNVSGQLGTGSTERSSTPAAVFGGLRLRSISTGRSHTCGLDHAGQAWCWGMNRSGQLGDGTWTLSTVPVAVAGGVRFETIEAGSEHTCAISTAGELWCWGYNGSGQLGNDSKANANEPVPVSATTHFRAVSAGFLHTCGLDLAGMSWCWGFGGWGQLGTGSLSDFLVPARVASNLTFTAISAGVDHSCGLTAADAAYCWGEGHFGQLGNGVTEMRDPRPTPAQPGLAFNVLSVGNAYTCGLAASGVTSCWGYNYWGELGDGSFSNRTAAVGVVGAPAFTALSTGLYHACGVTGTGMVYCWGQNEFGQLGRGSLGYEVNPVHVTGFVAAPAQASEQPTAH